MPVRIIIPHNIPGESNDAPKKFTNIDSEEFELTWEQPGNRVRYTVKPGETVIYPKYLVNHMSYHLARKIVKREKIAEYQAAHPTADMSRVDFVLHDEEREIELQKQSLKENPEVQVESPKPEVKEEPIESPKESEPEKKEETSFRCDICGFVAKSEFGLKAHKRKHNK